MTAELSSEAGAPTLADPVVAPAVAERQENGTEEVAVDGKETKPEEEAADNRKEAKAEEEVADDRTVTKREEGAADNLKEAKPEDAPAPTDPIEATVAAERDEKKTEEVADDGKEKKAADDGKEMKAADDGKEMKAADDGKEMKAADDGKETKQATDDGKEARHTDDGKGTKSEKEATDDGKETRPADDGKGTKSEKEATNDGKETKGADDGKGTKTEEEATDDGKETKPEKATNDRKKTKAEEEAAPSIEKSSSFREESNFLSDLKESEKKALVELRAKVEEAILENKLLKNQEEPNAKEKKEVMEEKAASHEAHRDEKAKPEETTEAKPDEAAHGKEKEMPSEKSIRGASSDDNGEEKPYPDALENEKGDEKAKLEQSAEANVESAMPDNEPAVANAKESTSDEEKAAPLEEKIVEACDKEVSLWGVPLLPSKGAEGTDVILLKFLRARDFKVKDAFEMLQSVLQWRKEYKVDSILEDESLGANIAAACYMEGVDRMGHPLCYNMSGVFDDDELYRKTFGTEEARERFTRWTVKLMEKGVKMLDFKPGSAASLMQITDLKNSPGPSKKELRSSLKQVVQLLQDNYPEFVARNIFINVPFWYYAFNAIISPFLTQRTKSKFIFARPSNVSETLLKYIPPEAIPIRYGGLKQENDTEFSDEDGKASELIAKSSSSTTIEIPTPEAGTTFVWDLNVLGWDVNYKEEFVPTDEGSYTILVRKNKKMGTQEGPLRNSFRNAEPGKIILTIENNTYWKKKVLYRYKMKKSSEQNE